MFPNPSQIKDDGSKDSLLKARDMLILISDHPIWQTVYALAQYCEQKLNDANYLEPISKCLISHYHLLTLIIQFEGLIKFGSKFDMEAWYMNEGKSSPIIARLFDLATDYLKTLRFMMGISTNSIIFLPSTQIMIKHTNVFDFHKKTDYFYAYLKDENTYDDIIIEVDRNNIFEDSFTQVFRIPSDKMRGGAVIVFKGEIGEDEGGLMREWFQILSKEIFNPNYALFRLVRGANGYSINPSSHINAHHLNYFKFVGRLIGLLFLRKNSWTVLSRDHFTSIFLDNPIDDLFLGLTFSEMVDEFGKQRTVDLIENGSKISVTDANKKEFLDLIAEYRMTTRIKDQLDSFLQGFYEVIPKNLISMFSEQELELLISGLTTYDLNDLKANIEYKGGYSERSQQIQWLFQVLESCGDELITKFVQFVTGSSRIPVQGFSHLQGMNGIQKFNIQAVNDSSNKLPTAHTCFNQLDLPRYETFEQLEKMIKIAITECNYGFGFC